MNNLFKGYNTGIPSKSYYFYSEPELQNNKCTNGIRQNSEMFKGMDYYSIDKKLINDGYYYCAIIDFADGDGKVEKVYKK